MLKNKSAKKKVNKELLRRPDVYVTALSSKNELKLARSATTGEKFDTLDERIDHEVDRLNKKIDVTMLQQEDKESHVVENTVDGITTDMVIKGKTMYKKTDGTYTDTWEEGCILESFGEKEDKISILSCGKNLAKLDLNNKNITPFEDRYRLDCVALYRGDEDIFDLKGKYKPNTPYVLSYYGKILDNSNANNYRIRVYYTDNTYTDGVVTGNKYEKRIIKTLSGKTVYKIIGYYGAMNGDFIVKDVMLEEGTQATQYESYKCDKKDILLNQYGFENGLNGINDINDELNSIRNVAIKKINKYINSNNETINIHTIRNNTISFNYNFIRDTPKGKNSNPNIMINCFETNLSCYSNDIEGCFGTPSGFFGSVLKTKLESQDINGIAKYVRENFKECYYELAEPVETPFTENINLKTFGERTYISFENSISGTSSFKAPVNAAATISRLNRENRALEEENKNLRQDFESTTLTLTDSDLELVKQNVDMDFRLMEVEFALDIPQAILSSNIKFKNKKGEVKSMARTPYEMMKIVILSGDYDREDYMHKVGKYYERGRMTKEEHDELMSLMTADEVISK